MLRRNENGVRSTNLRALLIRARFDSRGNQLGPRECEGEAVMSKPWRVDNGRFATHDSRTLLMHSPLQWASKTRLTRRMAQLETRRSRGVPLPTG